MRFFVKVGRSVAPIKRHTPVVVTVSLRTLPCAVVLLNRLLASADESPLASIAVHEVRLRNLRLKAIEKVAHLRPASQEVYGIAASHRESIVSPTGYYFRPIVPIISTLLLWLQVPVVPSGACEPSQTAIGLVCAANAGSGRAK